MLEVGKSDIQDLSHHNDVLPEKGGAIFTDPLFDTTSVFGSSPHSPFKRDSGDVGRAGVVSSAIPLTPRVAQRTGRSAYVRTPIATATAYPSDGVCRLCNACGLRWIRNNMLKKKKGPLSSEEQMFAKFSIIRKIT